MGKNLGDIIGKEVKPVIVVLVVQAAFAGVNIFYKLAVLDGMNMEVLVAYRLMFATATLIPLALILERNSITKLTWRIVFQGFLSGLFGGALGPILFIASLTLTSTTFATSMANLIPVATLILAVILRLEKMDIRTKAGQANLVGILVSIGGAMVLTFYKGKEFKLWSTNINLAKQYGGDDHVTTSKHFRDQFFGSLLALASCISFAIWYIVIAKMNKMYPFIYSSSALMCITAAIQVTIYTIITKRNWSAWKLGWDIRLLSVFFTGAIGNALTVVLMTWCLSILGSALIILGVYFVLWAKAKEKKNSSKIPIPAKEDQIQSPTKSEAVAVAINSVQDTNRTSDTINENLLVK
ncbi:Drug/metabolite transporter [Corchorus olitorius]|uniref:WAT1-related protein n=1 Tax=Corchorus olitorius TaxID=93759 RepID=A0A1R3IM25_9ROSI|nr:Drug/metabolite transporter [Corchorus olitorius]